MPEADRSSSGLTKLHPSSSTRMACFSLGASKALSSAIDSRCQEKSNENTYFCSDILVGLEFLIPCPYDVLSFIEKMEASWGFGLDRMLLSKNEHTQEKSGDGNLQSPILIAWCLRLRIFLSLYSHLYFPKIKKFRWRVTPRWEAKIATVPSMKVGFSPGSWRSKAEVNGFFSCETCSVHSPESRNGSISVNSFLSFFFLRSPRT